MKIDWKKQRYLVQRALVFILGLWIVGLGAGAILYFLLGDILVTMTPEEINALKEHPFVELSFMTTKIYIIAYVLFYTLPDKIKKANLWLRTIYFVLFYLFCILVYFSI